MKNLIFLLIAFLLLTAAVPTRVRKADKAEYARYIEAGKRVVSKLIDLDGKVTVLKVNGQYTDSAANFTVNPDKPIFWYMPGTKQTIAQPYEKLITTSKVVNEPLYKTSVKDFYTRYMVNKYNYEITRLEEAIKTFDPIYTERLTKQLNYTKSELAKIK